MIIKIDSNICKNIEALQYEVESRKDVIVAVLSGIVSMKSDKFNDYHTEYQNYFIKYNKAKQDMINQYVEPSFKNKPWNLTFDTCELLIEE